MIKNYKYLIAILLSAGLFLVAYSIIFGVETAKGFKWLLGKYNIRSTSKWRVKSYKSKLAAIISLLIVLGILWVVSGLLEAREFSNGGSEAHLWLGCFLAPPGVWIRWVLARLNGRGIGKKGYFKWIPFGTLAANVAAASMMAALATLKAAVSLVNIICKQSLRMPSSTSHSLIFVETGKQQKLCNCGKWHTVRFTRLYEYSFNFNDRVPCHARELSPLSCLCLCSPHHRPIVRHWHSAILRSSLGKGIQSSLMHTTFLFTLLFRAKEALRPSRYQ